MTRLLDPKDVVPVDIGGGDVVYIKRKMSFGDKRRLAAAAADSDSGAALAESTILLLELNVVSWTGAGFSDAAGKPLPITRENLDALDQDDVEKIVDVINTQNPKRAAGPFVTPSSPPSPTADASPSGSPASASSSASAGPTES